MHYKNASQIIIASVAKDFETKKHGIDFQSKILNIDFELKERKIRAIWLQRAPNHYTSSNLSSAYFNEFEFKFGKSIKFIKFELTKILCLLFDLIALFLCPSYFFRSPRHQQVNDNLDLHGVISKKIFLFVKSSQVYFTIRLKVRRQETAKRPRGHLGQTAPFSNT